MAGLRLPLVLEGVEYRGAAAPGEFTSDDGELIAFGPKLKFEVELPDGDVALFPVPSGQLEKCSPPMDWKGLKRGQRLDLTVVVGWKGSEPKGESYARVVSAVPAGVRAAAKPQAA